MSKHTGFQAANYLRSQPIITRQIFSTLKAWRVTIISGSQAKAYNYRNKAKRPVHSKQNLQTPSGAYSLMTIQRHQLQPNEANYFIWTLESDSKHCPFHQSTHLVHSILSTQQHCNQTKSLWHWNYGRQDFRAQRYNCNCYSSVAQLTVCRQTHCWFSRSSLKNRLCHHKHLVVKINTV